jgi:hypothetical protein
VRLPAPIRRITEAVRDRIVAPVREQLSVERANNELLAESVADLERQLFDPGWIRFTAFAEQEFSAEGMRQLRAICRLFTVKNPLLKRGAAVRSAYVHGQGVAVTARANGRKKVVGSQVSAWDPTVATLPDLTQMESVTYVNEIDVRRLAVGQPVSIALDAEPGKRLTGTITSVANVGEQLPCPNERMARVIRLPRILSRDEAASSQDEGAKQRDDREEAEGRSAHGYVLR